MHWIADFWWLWALGFIGTIAIAIYNQIKRMAAIDSENFFKGIYVFFGAGILNMIFSILLVVAIVLHIIDYSKQN